MNDFTIRQGERFHLKGKTLYLDFAVSHIFLNTGQLKGATFIRYFGIATSREENKKSPMIVCLCKSGRK